MKVLINRCYGGFSFSDKFLAEYKKRYPSKLQDCRHSDDIHPDYSRPDYSRSDPRVIALVEELGLPESSGEFAKFFIINIPDDVEYEITEYNGMENIKWNIPMNDIIKDLIDIVKGRKTDPEHKFTKILIDTNCSIYTLRSLISKI